MEKKSLLLFCTFIYLVLIIFSCDMVKAAYLTENSTWEGNLTGASYADTIFGDIDNDNDLDLVAIGICEGISCYMAKVYINNGTSLVENLTWETNLTALDEGSLAFGDIDNDGDLDLGAMGCASNGGIGVDCPENDIKIFIYINNGSTLIENSTWQQNLTKSYEGSLALADINNDGKLDLVLSGNSGSADLLKIYINNGTSLVENSDWQNNLVGSRQSAIVLGDIDNDNDLDLIASGKEGDISYTKVYINNGTSFVENSVWETNLLDATRSSLAVGDYDNDGDLDLALCGHTTEDNFDIYRNNGSTFQVSQTDNEGILAGVFDGSIMFGDYDNDGDLDIAITGREGYTNVYNNSNSTFFTLGESLTGLENGASLAWSDIDNDNDLDLASFGWLESIPLDKAYIYINNVTISNTPPNASTSFSSSFANGRLTLTWGNGSDAETPALGLYYNLRVGTSSGGNQIVSGVYGGGEDNSYFGNMIQRKSISLNGLSASTTYYWSVQTIDTGLAKSNWSTEQNYTTSTNIIDPVIILNSPADLYNTTNASITFNINVTDDSGLTNVTLWGNWTGWHANETNSTNLVNGTYYFSKNLSSYGDGVYAWKIRACDTTSNCINSSIRTFMIDTASPSVTLITPTDASTWTSSSTVTFTYNVSDLAIANCSLIINNAIVETDTSITLNTAQTFSRSLSNAAYTWSINCTDFTGHTANSTTRSLTVSYTAPASSGGGGGGAPMATTYNIGTLTAEGVIKEVSANDNIKFKVAGINKTATVTAVGSNNISIKIGDVNFSLVINETKKLDMNNDNVYDLAINVGKIFGGIASLSFRSISETVPIEAPAGEEKAGGNVTTEKKEEKIAEAGRNWIWIPVTLTILIAACWAYYFWKKGDFRKR